MDRKSQALIGGFLSHVYSDWLGGGWSRQTWGSRLRNVLLTEEPMLDHDPDEVSGVIEEFIRFTPVLWLTTIVFFIFGDLATTVLGFQTGQAIEVGPLAKTLIERHGMVALVVLKSLVILISYLLWRMTPTPHNVGVPLALAVVGVLATTWNMTVLATIYF